MYLPIDHQYSPSGPAPPSPVVVTTVPEYFGGRPTPPPTPPRTPSPTIDDYAPCPPTPLCVPLDAEQDELEWSDALNSAISPSTSPEPHLCWPISELHHYTTFADPLETLNNASDEARFDDPIASSEPPNVSDRLLYARESYACPSPVLTMMQRAILDSYGLETQPVNPFDCNSPLRLFSLTGGRTPKTGLHDVDQQSFKYYAKRPYLSLLRQPECFLSYCYSVSSIEALQHSLCTDWSLVYPTPIPPVIVRSRDLVGPHSLSRCRSSFAFIVPTKDSIWSTISRRGIDLDFRPIDQSLVIETCLVNMGEGVYFPQHIVASKFAVNVFLELADSASRSVPLCEYLGAYVLRLTDGVIIPPSIWADIDPEVKQALSDRVPHCFCGFKHPLFSRPLLSHVQFCYYKWDRNIVGLAEESFDRMFLAANPHIAQGLEKDDSADRDMDVQEDCHSDADQDTAYTSSAGCCEQKYVSFLDLSPRA